MAETSQGISIWGDELPYELDMQTPLIGVFDLTERGYRGAVLLLAIIAVWGWMR